MIVGLGAAVLIVRSNLPGRGIIDSLSMLPLAVPGIVLAFGYLSISIWFKRQLGEKHADVSRRAGIPGRAARSSPTPRGGCRTSCAPRSPACSRRRAISNWPRRISARRGSPCSARITVPLILANLLAGALLAFAFAMLEVSDSLILAQRTQYYPITKAIFELSQRLGDGLYIASALGVWAMVLLTLTILSANSLLGKNGSDLSGVRTGHTMRSCLRESRR